MPGSGSRGSGFGIRDSGFGSDPALRDRFVCKRTVAAGDRFAYGAVRMKFGGVRSDKITERRSFDDERSARGLNEAPAAPDGVPEQPDEGPESPTDDDSVQTGWLRRGSGIGDRDRCFPVAQDSGPYGYRHSAARSTCLIARCRDLPNARSDVSVRRVLGIPRPTRGDQSTANARRHRIPATRTSVAPRLRGPWTSMSVGDKSPRRMMQSRPRTYVRAIWATAAATSAATSSRPRLASSTSQLSLSAACRR